MSMTSVRYVYLTDAYFHKNRSKREPERWLDSDSRPVQRSRHDSPYHSPCDRLPPVSPDVGLDIQDDQGRHEVGMVENTEKTPIVSGQGCLFISDFHINKVPGQFSGPADVGSPRSTSGVVFCPPMELRRPQSGAEESYAALVRSLSVFTWMTLCACPLCVQ